MTDRFCVTCGYNYNDCESIFEAFENHHGDLPKTGYSLCPKCSPEDWKPEVYPGYEIRRKPHNKLDGKIQINEKDTSR